MKIHFRRVGPLDNNVFVLTDDEEREALIVDPAWGSEALVPWARGSARTIAAILDTHGHFDHTYENARFREQTDAPLLHHRDDSDWVENQSRQGEMFGVAVPDSPRADAYVKDGEVLRVGQEEVTLIHCPGHTRGSVCVYAPSATLAADDEGAAPRPAVLTGDVLFRGSIGRTDLPGGSLPVLLDSIRARLLTLPDDTLVLPGHGDFSTVGEEREHNPFLTGRYF